MREQIVVSLVRASALHQDLLGRAEEVAAQFGLQQWALGGGCVRNLVWDHLHGFRQPTAFGDADFAFWAQGCASDAEIQAALDRGSPKPWDAVNQARVHEYYGHAPYTSMEEGMGSWLETASAIGVRSHQGRIEVVAPLGMDDLFDLVIRANPRTRQSDGGSMVRERAEKKGWLRQWPLLRLL